MGVTRQNQSVHKLLPPCNGEKDFHLEESNPTSRVPKVITSLLLSKRVPKRVNDEHRRVIDAFIYIID